MTIKVSRVAQILAQFIENLEGVGRAREFQVVGSGLANLPGINGDKFLRRGVLDNLIGAKVDGDIAFAVINA